MYLINSTSPKVNYPSGIDIMVHDFEKQNSLYLRQLDQLNRQKINPKKKRQRIKIDEVAWSSEDNRP